LELLPIGEGTVSYIVTTSRSLSHTVLPLYEDQCCILRNMTSRLKCPSIKKFQENDVVCHFVDITKIHNKYGRAFVF
jgi:hypothetical protein